MMIEIVITKSARKRLDDAIIEFQIKIDKALTKIAKKAMKRVIRQIRSARLQNAIQKSR